MPLRHREDPSEPRAAPTPPFDWRAEQNAQKRELARFAGEMMRAITLRGGSPAARQLAERIRERWDQLVRRLEGRWARGSEIWDRQAELIERLAGERALLESLLTLDEALAVETEVDAMLGHTLRTVVRLIPCDGALVQIADAAGQPLRRATERRKGRPWPPAADADLADQVIVSAAHGRRVTIEGRPVKSTPRDPHRVAQWLACGITHGADTYGAIVLGRTPSEEPFNEENLETAERVGRHLARALTARLGAGARAIVGAGPKPAGFDGIWGEAAALRRAIDLAHKLTAADTPILLEGEMGTGRETLARAIHRQSPRGKGPFVVFRGSDLPEETVARGLFGAVTVGPDGRAHEEPGDIELAEGGTLFVDDLAAIDLALQVRLIRLLSEGIFERVGDRTPRHAYVRLMIATTENVDEDLARGRLRADLYYLITAGRISLPPLRERGNDIIELARRFAVASGQKTGKRIDGIDLEAARLLESASWPGNIQQLAQVIERAALVARGPLITAADLPREIAARAVAAGIDTAVWSQQAAAAIRQAGEAGQSGDYRLFRRARRLAQGALDAAFAHAVLRAVGKHPSKAASHAGMHRAQWWRLWRSVRDTGAAAPRESTEGAKSRQDQQQK
ncbi:MAG TPA: sigma 54-interacting transcriptional regulator [bacterium]|nr:sigma 54-interacting transcriptional regulator [bacterium]